MNVQFDNTAEKKCAIFGSTLRLVRAHGFHGSPISQIAQEAGVATGTIYHYFSSKDELILELFQHCKTKIGKSMFKEEEAQLPYPRRFVTVWTNLVRFYIEHPAVLSFMEQFYSSPYVTTIYGKDSRVQMQDEMSKFLEQGIEKGHVKPLDINILSAAFIGTVTAAAKRHINGYYTFNEHAMHEMVAIIWDGIKI